MIIYCIDMSKKKCLNALGVGYHGTKRRMMMSVAVMKAQQRPPSEGVMVSSDHSKVQAFVC